MHLKAGSIFASINTRDAMRIYMNMRTINAILRCSRRSLDSQMFTMPHGGYN